MFLLYRSLVIAALLATCASSLSVYPHELAYFNELAGGPENGHRHLVHSSQYWGQDILFLKEWSRAHPEARPLFLKCSLLYDPSDLGVPTSGHPGYVGEKPSSAWYVLSPVELQRMGMLSPVSGGEDELYGQELSKELRSATDVTRVGSSLYVYGIGNRIDLSD